jgi:hypothetical protein
VRERGRSSAPKPVKHVYRGRRLERYLAEGSPRLQHVAEITGDLARREGLGQALPSVGIEERELEADGQN